MHLLQRTSVELLDGGAERKPHKRVAWRVEEVPAVRLLSEVVGQQRRPKIDIRITYGIDWESKQRESALAARSMMTRHALSKKRPGTTITFSFKSSSKKTSPEFSGEGSWLRSSQICEAAAQSSPHPRSEGTARKKWRWEARGP